VPSCPRALSDPLLRIISESLNILTRHWFYVPFWRRAATARALASILRKVDFYSSRGCVTPPVDEQAKKRMAPLTR
jgi:hypothetical protein